MKKLIMAAAAASVVLAPVAAQAGTLLSTIARFGHEQESQRRSAFEAGVDALELDNDHRPTFEATDDPNFSRLNRALKDLRLLRPLAKPKLIKACAATATADGHVSGLEGALMRGFGAALDCPLPPSIYGGANAPDYAAA